MADMTKSRAIEILKNHKNRLNTILNESITHPITAEKTAHFSMATEEMEAVDKALTAMRGWVRTEDRLPAEADTGDDGKILCVTVGVFGDTVILHVFWGIVAEHPERYPYWMPLPPLPEVEG